MSHLTPNQKLARVTWTFYAEIFNEKAFAAGFHLLIATPSLEPFECGREPTVGIIQPLENLM